MLWLHTRTFAYFSAYFSSLKGHGCLAASPTIGMDMPVRSSLQVESKDSTILKRKLHYVDGANTSEGITSCDARYMEMETSGLVSIMAADLPDVQSVEQLEQSVLSDTPDTEVASLEASSESNQCEFPEVVMNEERNFPSLAFTLAFDGDNEEPVVVISQRRLANHPPYGLVSRVQITIKRNKYLVNILMREWDSGELYSKDDIHNLCNKFVSETKYKFCPGLDPEQYQQEYFDKIRFHIKTVRQTEWPFHRVNSVNCALWFLLAPNVTATEKSSKEVNCPACKRLVTDLDCQCRRTLSKSPARKLKRQAPSSRARLLYMSPASQQKRKQRTQVERSMTS